MAEPTFTLNIPTNRLLVIKDVSCLRTIFGLNLLANSVILKCKLWEWVWWGLCSLQTFFGFIGEYITPLLILAKGYSFAPFWCLCQKLSLSPLYFNKTLLHTHTQIDCLLLWIILKWLQFKIQLFSRIFKISGNLYQGLYKGYMNR